MAKISEAVVLKVAVAEVNCFPQLGVKRNIVQNYQPLAEIEAEKSLLIQTLIQLLNFK